jgi:pimeloyl-ACP methyl ester carboxylesterase
MSSVGSMEKPGRILLLDAYCLVFYNESIQYFIPINKQGSKQKTMPDNTPHKQHSPILFIQGTADSARIWRPQLDYFGPSRAIAIDLPVTANDQIIYRKPQESMTIRKQYIQLS